MSVAEKKKLGFRDKILKMLDTDSPKDKKKHFFEETSIKFTLRGGSSHSELLVAEAIYHKNSDESDMPLPIICKWFNKSKTDEITEIEGITGAFYQPNADDVGSYIVVEATPILEDNEYTGKPLRGEAGPIVLDQQVKEEVQELLEAERVKAAVKLEGVIENGQQTEESSKLSSSHAFPLNCSLQIDNERITIEVNDKNSLSVKCLLLSGSSAYPTIRINKRSNSQFELAVGLNKWYRLNSQSSHHRDVIAIALKQFLANKLQRYREEKKKEKEQNMIEQNQAKVINDSQPEKIIGEAQNQNEASKQTNKDLSKESPKNGNTNNINKSKIQQNQDTFENDPTEESLHLFVTLNELQKKASSLEQIRDDLKYQVAELTAELNRKEEKLQNADTQLSQTRESLRAEKDANEILKMKHTQYMHEKLFFTQETQIIQDEMKKKDQEILELRQEVEQQKKKSELKPLIDEEEVEKLRNLIEDLEKKLNNQNCQIDHLSNDLRVLENINSQFGNEKEELLNEVIHFKKKCEGLQQEKTKYDMKNSIDSAQKKNGSTSSSHHSITFQANKDCDSSSENNFNNFKFVLKTQTSSSSSKAAETPASGTFTFPKESSQSNSHPPLHNLKIGKSDSLVSQESSHSMKLNADQQQDFKIMKDELISKIEENQKFQKKISQLELTIHNLTQAYNNDLQQYQNSPSKKKQSTPSNESILQKLVNSLTEVITEKDLALDNQKKVIKELMNKLADNPSHLVQ